MSYDDCNVSITELVSLPIHKHAFVELFKLMRAHAVVRMSYEFSGSGDSGNLETSPEWEGLHADNEGFELGHVKCSVPIKEPNGRAVDPSGKWVQQYSEHTCENLENLGYRMAMVVLNNDPHDWYNNDGGYGHVIFSFTPEDTNRVEMDMNVNVTTSEPYPSEVEFPNG